MQRNILRDILDLSLEEKIFNGACLTAIVCSFFPWISGEWIGGQIISYSALGFYTSFIGLTVVLLYAFIILITLLPLAGGPTLIQKKHKEAVRLFCSVQALILVIAIWTILTNFTFEFSRLSIHFGLYCTMVSGIAVVLYSFLIFKEQHRRDVEDDFHMPRNTEVQSDAPPPPEPEDHRWRN